jgi:hypothetical protein
LTALKSSPTSVNALARIGLALHAHLPRRRREDKKPVDPEKQKQDKLADRAAKLTRYAPTCHEVSQMREGLHH